MVPAYQSNTRQAALPVKRNTPWLSMVLVLLLAQATPLLAADYRLNVGLSVHPGHSEQFDEAWKTLRNELQARGYPFYTVVSDTDSGRNFVSVIPDLASLSTIASHQSQLTSSTDSSIQNAIQQLTASSHHAHSYITYYDRALSHVPEGSYSGPYHRKQIFTFDTRNRDALAQAIAGLRDAYAAVDEPTAFHIMWTEYGGWAGGPEDQQGGQVTMLTSAPSPEEHAAIEARVREKTGKDFEAFEAALWRLVNSSTQRYLLSRPELTLKPTAE